MTVPPVRPIDPAIVALDDEDRVRLARLVLALRRRGVVDAAVLAAIEQAPRKIFVAAEHRARAFEDVPLPIECGQTATAPSTVGLVLQRLRVGPEHRVLDVGTGSGFTAAVLARMARRVFTVDRYRTLVELAAERFAALRLANIRAAVADGLEGWPEHAPYDRILVSGAVPRVPDALLGGLAPDGVMIVPVGEAGRPQALRRVVRARDGFHAETVAEVRFVPLVPGRAATL